MKVADFAISKDTQIIINDHLFTLNKWQRAIVPKEKEEFESFVDALFKTIEKPAEEQKLNYKIVKSYPFLLPKNRWDRAISITGENAYDFTRTELTIMPTGWFIAFGSEIVRQLNKAMLSTRKSLPYEYTITDIKEKYGGLRWYDTGATKEMYQIIDNFEEQSKTTCVICGEKRKPLKDDWGVPICDNVIGCPNKLEDRYKNALKKLAKEIEMKDYEKELNEFFDLEEEKEEEVVTVNHSVVIKLSDLSDEGKKTLEKEMGNEFKHINNHFAKNKDNKWNRSICSNYKYFRIFAAYYT